VNNQLTGKQLLHCLRISDSEFIISDGSDALIEALFDVKEDVKELGLRILVDDKDAQLPRNVFEINERFRSLTFFLLLISRFVFQISKI